MYERESVKNLYPIFLNINTKRCVVVGRGQVAERRVKSLLDCGALVKVASSRLSKNLELMAERKLIEVMKRDFQPGDLEGALLAVAAYFNEMLGRDMYLSPSQFEAQFLSLAHGGEEIESTIAVARQTFLKLRDMR